MPAVMQTHPRRGAHVRELGICGQPWAFRWAVLLSCQRCCNHASKPFVLRGPWGPRQCLLHLKLAKLDLHQIQAAAGTNSTQIPPNSNAHRQGLRHSNLQGYAGSAGRVSLP